MQMMDSKGINENVVKTLDLDNPRKIEHIEKGIEKNITKVFRQNDLRKTALSLRVWQIDFRYNVKIFLNDYLGSKIYNDFASDERVYMWYVMKNA